MANAKPKRKKPAPAEPETHEVSELGRVLTEIAERYRKSGAKLLTRREIEREVIRLRTDR